MSTADGMFNAPAENLTAALDTADLHSTTVSLAEKKQGQRLRALFSLRRVGQQASALWPCTRRAACNDRQASLASANK